MSYRWPIGTTGLPWFHDHETRFMFALKQALNQALNEPGAGMAKQAETVKKTTMADKVADLRSKRAELELGGGKERIDKHHAAGKLTARERVAKLVDKGSFQEIGLFAQPSRHLLRHGRQKTARRRRRHRMRHHRWPSRASCQSGLHRRRRRRRRNPQQQGRRNAEPVTQNRQPLHLHQRLRRRPRSGGH